MMRESARRRTNGSRNTHPSRAKRIFGMRSGMLPVLRAECRVPRAKKSAEGRVPRAEWGVPCSSGSSAFDSLPRWQPSPVSFRPTGGIPHTVRENHSFTLNEMGGWSSVTVAPDRPPATSGARRVRCRGPVWGIPPVGRNDTRGSTPHAANAKPHSALGTQHSALRNEKAPGGLPGAPVTREARRSGSGDCVRGFVRTDARRHLVLQMEFPLLQCLLFDLFLRRDFLLRRELIQPMLTGVVLFDPMTEFLVFAAENLLNFSGTI